MIAKILKSGSEFGGVKYNTTKIDKGAAEIVGFFNVPSLLKSLSTNDMLAKDRFCTYLKAVSKVSGIKNKQFHVAISSKGRNMSKEELTWAAHEYMKKMGYGQQPYCIFFHKDTKNNHVHIVSTRVNQKDGKTISDKKERIRSTAIIKALTAQIEGKVNLSPEVQFATDRDECLQWNIPSQRQFMSLMQDKGYTCKPDNDNPNNIACIKGGICTGVVSAELIEKRIRAYRDGISFRKNKDLPDEQRPDIYKRKQLLWNKLIAMKRKGYTAQQASENIELRDKLGFKITLLPHIGDDGKEQIAWICHDYISKSIFKGSDVLSLEDFSKQLSEAEKDSVLADIGKEVLYDDKGDVVSWDEYRERLSRSGYELLMLGGDAYIRIKDSNKGFKIDDDIKKALMKKQRINECRKKPIHNYAEAKILAALCFVPVREILPEKYAPVDDVQRLCSMDTIRGCMQKDTPLQIKRSCARYNIGFVRDGEAVYVVDKKNAQVFTPQELELPFLTAAFIKDEMKIKTVSVKSLEQHFEKWSELRGRQEQEYLEMDSRSRYSLHSESDDDYDRRRTDEDALPDTGQESSLERGFSPSIIDIFIAFMEAFAQSLQQGGQSVRGDGGKRKRKRRPGEY